MNLSHPIGHDRLKRSFGSLKKMPLLVPESNCLELFFS